jgi:acetyltransferase-like isoleucine patch superfamily enzyme
MKNKFKIFLQVLRYLPQTIYFNFYYLPLYQAVKLPIWLYKPKLKKLKGRVFIEGVVKTGMIRLGFDRVSIYPSSGIMIENRGSIVFEGRCDIGNNSFISIGEKGCVRFGSLFSATTSLKLVCYKSVTFDDRVSFGYDCMCIDTDFHSIKTEDGKLVDTACGNIKLGSDCWIAMKCILMKNTVLPNKCVVASNSLLNRSYEEFPEKIMLAGSPAVLKKTGVWRDVLDDKVYYN